MNLYPTCPPPLGSSGAQRQYIGYESSTNNVEALKLFGNCFEHVRLLSLVLFNDEVDENNGDGKGNDEVMDVEQDDDSITAMKPAAK